MTLGEKLAKLRREHNYTQEEFAEILNVSRQAVSKWESDLAYPETDKLIRIGELYGCSMDYLLKNDAAEIKAPESRFAGSEEKQPPEPQNEEEKEEPDGENEEEDERPTPRQQRIISAVNGVTAICVTIAYLAMGFVFRLWHPAWVIFFLIPLVATLADAIAMKKASVFAYPVLVAGVYLLMGFLAKLWHPGWLIFLTVPVYYLIADAASRK